MLFLHQAGHSASSAFMCMAVTCPSQGSLSPPERPPPLRFLYKYHPLSGAFSGQLQIATPDAPCFFACLILPPLCPRTRCHLTYSLCILLLAYLPTECKLHVDMDQSCQGYVTRDTRKCVLNKFMKEALHKCWLLSRCISVPCPILCKNLLRDP